MRVDGMFTRILDKYLKATQALCRAHARDPHHPEVHVRIVQLARQGRSFIRCCRDVDQGSCSGFRERRPRGR